MALTIITAQDFLALSSSDRLGRIQQGLLITAVNLPSVWYSVQEYLLDAVQPDRLRQRYTDEFPYFAVESRGGGNNREAVILERFDGEQGADAESARLRFAIWSYTDDPSQPERQAIFTFEAGANKVAGRVDGLSEASSLTREGFIAVAEGAPNQAQSIERSPEVEHHGNATVIHGLIFLA